MAIYNLMCQSQAIWIRQFIQCTSHAIKKVQSVECALYTVSQETLYKDIQVNVMYICVVFLDLL